ncbi:MAG TPA: DUF3072 domain-containing protein [Nocardioides sp.]|nr:DUF3072 domain-containing protein [Nocardioides sp.]
MRDPRRIRGRSASPTARALKALELIPARPGITADEPGAGLGVAGRAARRCRHAREAGEQLSPDLGKAEASEHIERLQEKTGRGA